MVRRGWPQSSAFVMAALLHAIVLGGLMPPSLHDPPPVQQPRGIRVTIVQEPPPEPIQAEPEPPIAEAEPIEHPRGAPAADAAPSPADTPLAAAPPAPPRKPAQTARVQAKQPRITARADRPKAKPRDAPAQSKASSGGASVEPDSGRDPHPMQGELAAVYDVLVDAAGGVQAVRLALSSGRPGYDEAGERMIRRAMTFEPPRAASPDGTVMVVTIRFSPER